MPADTATPNDLRRARRASALSIAWSLLAGSAMIAVGALSASTVLVAVGAVAYVDGVGSVALAHHFTHGLRHAGLDDRFERRAHRIVTAGLLSVGVATVAVSGARLVGGSTGDASAFGVIVAATSAAMLTMLATAKVRIGRRISSRALVADGHVSAIGAAQGVVAAAGALVTSVVEVRWADPLAALFVAVVAIALALATWRPTVA